MNKFEDEYHKKQKIKIEMERLKYETAKDLGIEIPEMQNSANVKSRDIGLYAGPVGGGMVKKLVANAKRQIVEQSTNKE